MKVAVGSRNPVKVEAARSIIERVWPDATIEGIDVHSGVRAMPMSDDECKIGALTGGLVLRQEALALGVAYALAPFVSSYFI